MKESIVEEVRAIRHQIADECGNDIDAIIAYAVSVTSAFKKRTKVAVS